MGKLIKKILRESSELDWIHSAGQNKILTINKLKELFKKNNIDVDWDIEYDRSADGHGEYNEYFGKFYYDRENPISYNESYFIELYEKENGHLFFQLYRYDEEDNYYHRDEVYSQIETSSKDPEKFWRTVGWLVLYQMGKIAGGHGEETFDVENTIEESNELDWMKGPPSFRFGEISRDLRNYFSKGDKVYLTGILHLSEGNEDITLHLNNEPAVVKLVRVNSGVLDLILGENITSLPIWLSAMSDSDLDLGGFNEDDDIMITTPYKNINESDLDWIRDVQPNQKVKPWNGNIGYPIEDKTSPTYGKVYLYTDDEGVTREIKVGGLTSKHRTKNYKGEWFGSDGEVSFYDASIMSSDIESKNYDPYYPDPFEGKYRITMSRQEYNDNARKGKLTLTPNNNSITESDEDFDWASGFTWYKEMLDGMLTDCKPLRVANFNIRNNQPYSSAGGPSIMFLSRCKEWWDYFRTVPSTPSAFGARGPAEWFTEDNYEFGEYGVIWNPRWGRNNVTPQVGDLKDEHTSAITTQ